MTLRIKLQTFNYIINVKGRMVAITVRNYTFFYRDLIFDFDK